MRKAPIPEPTNWGKLDVEPFETYFERWPIEYAHVGGRREIYCEPTDVRFQSANSHFELEGRFAELSRAY